MVVLKSTLLEYVLQGSNYYIDILNKDRKIYLN